MQKSDEIRQELFMQSLDELGGEPLADSGFQAEEPEREFSLIDQASEE
jgi:hypothetical protein